MRLQHLLVLLGLIHAEVREELSALGDLAEESAAGGVVLLVLLEMLREHRDLLCKKCDLHLGRTCVLGMCPVLGNESFLLCALESHTMGKNMTETARPLRSETTGEARTGHYSKDLFMNCNRIDV